MIINSKFNAEETNFLQAIAEYAENEVLVSDYINENYAQYYPSFPDGEYKKNILRKIYKNYLARDREKGMCPVTFTDKDILFLQSLPTDYIKRVFYSLQVRAKVRPHSSGWVSLDFQNTMLYGFSEKQVSKMKLEDLSDCGQYGFESRVSGSTKPVLCFKIPDTSNGVPVVSFLDGESYKKFMEVIQYGANTNK